MAIKLQIRRDTLANWTANPSVVLLEGEIGYVTDTRNMKIGDGTTVWSSLNYQAPYYTAANSGAPNTLLALKVSDSRVGIGTIAPAATLGVAGNVYIGNQTNSGTDGTLALISTGGLNYIQSGQNVNATSAPLVIGAIGGGTNWMRVTSGGVGIGVTASPSNTLNIESTTPTIRLKDTTAANTAHCLIDANGDDGSVVIAADPTAQGTAASTVSLSVDNTTRLQATTTGVAITGTTTSSGALTVSSGGLTVSAGGATVTAGGLAVNAGGLTVSAGSVSLPTNTVALASLANMAAAGVLGATAAGAVAQLTTGSGGTAKTALGLGTSAYSNFVPMPTFQTGVGVGQITAGYDFASTGGTTSITVGAAGQTWAYLNVVRGTSSSSNGQARVGVVTTATAVTTTQFTESWVFAIRIL